MAERIPKSRSRTSACATHVALLRGINVGGKNMIPMADLAAMFDRCGCTSVQTYIQSGNVVFSAPPAVMKGLCRDVSEAIAKRFKFRPAVMVRSAEEIAAVVAANPFAALRMDSALMKLLHVGFFAEAPSPQLIASLDPKRSPGDRFAVHGREIYVHYANGAGKTRLTGAYIDSALSTSSTFRNWRTVLTLLEMLRQ